MSNVNMNEFRVVLTGGPTGGHLFPLIAVLEEVKAIAGGLKIPLQGHFIGNASDFAEELRRAGILLHKMVAPKVRRYLSLRNLIEPWLAPLAILQAFWHLWLIMPDVVFSKGGGPTLFVVFIAWLYRIPILIHESDSVPGAANRRAARFAKYIAVSFPRSIDSFPKGKTFLIGHPIRRALLSGRRGEGLRITGFRQELSFLFVWAGSQGAEVINDAMLNILPQLLPRVQVLHQCGKRNFARIEKESAFMLKALAEDVRSNYRLEAFMDIDRLLNILAACDLVVARAGAGTIFELAASGKPTILIPLPHAAGDHQRLNAYDYAEQGGGEVMEQQNLTPHLLAERILMLLGDAERRAQMSAAARKFSRPDAARIIAEELLRLAER